MHDNVQYLVFTPCLFYFRLVASPHPKGSMHLMKSESRLVFGTGPASYFYPLLQVQAVPSQTPLVTELAQ